jgi:uncharacterized protein (TIGR02145 family)
MRLSPAKLGLLLLVPAVAALAATGDSPTERRDRLLAEWEKVRTIFWESESFIEIIDELSRLPSTAAPPAETLFEGAALALHTGRIDSARTFLSRYLEHPQADREGKKRAKEWLSDLRISTGADTTRKTVRDPRDGHVYPIVALGGNTWLAQNLEYQSDLEKCTPGTMKLCFQYGGYYDLASAREACMPGWRLSTAADWTALLDAVADRRTLKGPELEGTNQTGFHATPSGAVYPQASMAKVAFSQEGYFWEDIDGDGSMNKRNTEYGEADFERLPASRDDRYSVRCVLGERPTPPARGLTSAPNPAPVHGGRITDARDGQIYRVARMGGHNWLARNLNYAGPGGNTGMCYDNRPGNCATMGRLYDWRSAAGLPKPFNENEYGLGPGRLQGICPEGWFLPNIEDWVEFASAASSPPSMDLAGQALKAKKGWKRFEGASGNGEDRQGFAALPSGYRHADRYEDRGEWAWWWSGSDTQEKFAWTIGVSYASPELDKEYLNKTDALAVRCMQ